MGSVGRYNPLPFHVGGDPSPTEKVWRQLRSALGRTSGDKEVAGPIGGIDDEWRLAKARIIARCLQLDELAALQAIPDKATVHLPVYEALLRVPAAETDVERQAAVAEVYTAQLQAIIPEIRAHLKAIDSTLDVVTRTRAEVIYTQFGKTLAARPTDDYMTVRNHALLPNFSSDFVLVVRWPGGVPDAVKRDQVERYLNDVLPSWVDYTIQNQAGFFLDGFNGSLLDLTAFG